MDTKPKIPCTNLAVTISRHEVARYGNGESLMIIEEVVFRDACGVPWRGFQKVIGISRSQLYGICQCQHPLPGGREIPDDQLHFHRNTQPQWEADAWVDPEKYPSPWMRDMNGRLRKAGWIK